jgi:uncharacterized protein YdaU (DUF1376 family)
MSTHPYVPLYVDDYEAATAHLTAEEDGVYNRLLRLCWRTPGCSLPNDPAWLARKIRLSAEDFDRVARPVIDEFFRVQRGRLIQKRLKAEYDDISRKKMKRVKAGKAGGEAKARKTKENDPSNASVLLGHTRAFPEPEPEPEEEGATLPVAPSATGSDTPGVRSDPWDRDEAFSAAWSACTPEMRKRAKSRAKAWQEWVKARRKIDPTALVSALRSYVAGDPDVKRTGGPGLHLWLRDAGWDVWTSGHVSSLPAPDPNARWTSAVREFRANGYWPRDDLGPPPGREGCRCPPDVLAAHGIAQPKPVANDLFPQEQAV